MADGDPPQPPKEGPFLQLWHWLVLIFVGLPVIWFVFHDFHP